MLQTRNKLILVVRLVLLATLAIIFAPTDGEAGIMTFDPPFTSGWVDFTEDGLRVTSTAAMYLNQSDGATAMYPSTVAQTMTLTLASGGPFALVSIDIRELGAIQGHSVVFEGALVGGGIVSFTVVTDGVDGFENFEFPATFTNLASVSWDHADHDANCAYDNIVAARNVSSGSVALSEVKARFTRE